MRPNRSRSILAARAVHSRAGYTCCLLAGFTLATVLPRSAFADSPPTDPATATNGTAAVDQTPLRLDKPRFRGGISAGVGGFFGGYTAGDQTFSATLGGIDGRLGVQLNDLIGIYAQPHLSMGSVTDGANKGLTGVLAGSVLADFTVLNRLFVGVGGGVGLLNNPSGPMLHFRLGGYPLLAFGEGARRKALVVAVDLRFVFLSAPYSTATMPFFTIGYEAF